MKNINPFLRKSQCIKEIESKIKIFYIQNALVGQNET